MSNTAEGKKDMASSDHISTENETTINEFLEAMKKSDGDSDEALEKAFKVLSKDKENALVSADVLRRAIEKRGLKLTIEDVEETVLLAKEKAKKEGHYEIQREEFIKIVKLLMGPTVIDQQKKIYGILGRGEGKKVVLSGESEEGKTGKLVKTWEKIVLYGESGVGKTWMARKTAALALRKGKFDVAVWVYLNRIYEGLSLQESVAYQVSVLAAFEESEAEEAKKKAEAGKDKEEPEESEETKKMKKQEKIEGMIHEAMVGKRLLMILDDEGSRMKLKRGKDAEKMMSLVLKPVKGNQRDIDLGKMLGLNELKSCQVMITSKESVHEGDVGIKMRPLTWDESKKLVFQEMSGDHKSDEINELVEFFIGESKMLPGEILLIARVVSYFVKTESGLQKLRNDKEVLKKGEGLKVGNVLIMGYERLPTSILIDCYSSETPERHFLHRGGMVNFNELISYWILEGHLGHFDRIEDAYEKGHCVLMELLNCGLLQKQEGDYVAPSGSRFDLDIHNHNEFFRKMHPGLGVTFDMKLGRVAFADGMIRTFGSIDHKKKKLSTLLLNGNHIGEELVANSLFEPQSELEQASQTELEVLAIFNPTRRHFQLPLLKMQKLRLLMLKGCQFLDSIEHNFQWRDDLANPKALRKSQSFPSTQKSNLNPTPSPSLSSLPSQKLEKLTVLEISGPSSLKTIPNQLFQKTPHLKTLNMSHLQINCLPESFYHLKEIEFLILRGCSSLLELGTLQNCKDLQVVDISGASSFEKFHDKSLKGNAKLQILNVSETSIKVLPLINPCGELKFISFSGCKALQRMRMISKLRNLQILDVSGATEVEEFCDPSLEDLKHLVILDVSRTAIKRLPSNISNPRYLYLRGCSRLRRIPPIEGLSKVEVLDLSGSSRLGEIRTEFFKNLEGLRELNLSETGIEHLQFVPSLVTLRRLLLSQCLSLEKFEELSSLVHLEFLDLSGCSALNEMKEETFDKMNHLWHLNLSGIQLEQLPSLSKLIQLKELYVRDCPKLTKLPGIEELHHLEILDHSGTFLNPQPSFSNPDRHPLVLGANIDNIDHQQLLKKLGAIADEVTSDESELPDLTLEDLRQCKWSISNWPGEATVNEGEPVYGVHFLQLLKKHPSLLTKNFSQFHFLVYPTDAKAKLPDKSSYKSELDLRDIYFEQVLPNKLECRSELDSRQQAPLKKPERCLEIREFNDFPPSLGYLLKQAEFVVVIDNPFLKSLLNLGVDNIIAIKAFWIESCNELEHVIASEKEEGSEKPGESAESKGEGNKKPEQSAESKEEKMKNFDHIVKKLEILWISDALNLSSISNGDIQTIGFTSLKSLYLEYCPKLCMISPSSSQLKSLKILYVKYCQNLKSLFTGDSAQLNELTELHLWGLEELTHIACKVPSLHTLRVGECPLLEHVFDASSTQSPEQHVEGHENLKILHIKFCDKLKAICKSSDDGSSDFPNLRELELSALPELQKVECRAPALESLKVGECPSLQDIVVGNLDKGLKILDIKYCDKLKTMSKDSGLKLEKIEKVELLSLPELDNFNGGKLPPSLNNDKCLTWGCPKLQMHGQTDVRESQIQESNNARIPRSFQNWYP